MLPPLLPAPSPSSAAPAISAQDPAAAATNESQTVAAACQDVPLKEGFACLTKAASAAAHVPSQTTLLCVLTAMSAAILTRKSYTTHQEWEHQLPLPPL